MARELTRKQRAWIAGVLAGKSGTQAAMDAYDTVDRATAAVIAAENLGKPKIRAEIKKALDDQGLSIQDGLVVVRDALTAEATNRAGVRVPLWAARLAAAREVFRLCRAYDGPSARTAGEGGARHAHVHLELGSQVSRDVLSWLAKWFRSYGLRPTPEQFSEVFGRPPTEIERKLLADQREGGLDPRSSQSKG